jgi:peptidyl-prolyl cis-trans isomerase D
MFVLEARAKGILISDRLVQAQIMADENFRNEAGRYDRLRFLRVIDSNGYTEATYTAQLRGALARSYLVGAVSSFEGAPARALADRLFAYRSEYRVAEVLTIPTEAMKPPAPTDEQLAAYHKANAVKYTAPEYRTLSLVWVRPEDAAALVKVTEADLKSDYEKRKPEFTTPETRAVRQIILKDEATAKQAYEALIGGRTFEAVAKEFAKADPINMGKLSKAQLREPVAEIGEAVFKLKVGEVTQPIKSPLSWHILKVDEIVPEALKPFDEVKEQVEKDFRQRHAIRIIAELREKFDDALGSGKKLEAAAQGLGLKLAKIGPVDAQGKDDKGATVEGLPEDGEFLRRVFKLGKGEEGELIDLRNQGFYSVRVDAITPSALRPLDSIKEKVTADWTAEERAKLAKAEAEKLAAEAKTGKSLEEVAKPGNYTVKKSKPVNRGESTQATAGSIEDRIFAVKPGEVATAQVREGWAVVKVEAAKDERSEDDRKKAREDFDKALREAWEQDFRIGYSNYLRGRYPVKVERETIDQLLGGRRQ